MAGMLGEAQRAVLIGPNQQENLALQYLASSADQAGHDVSLVAYNWRVDLESCVREALRDNPHCIGIGIPFQYCIADAVLLAKELRSAGFRGHLTCGGHVPTFCYAELLRDAPFDSVVRHEGEETFVELLGLLGRGEDVRGLAGLVWKDGDEVVTGPCRPPVRDIDTLPWPRRGDAPYLVAGVPVAFVVMARGCTGECNYCSIRAFAKSAGGPPYRMRSPACVADEVANLYHERGTKVFFVQDDLFILMSEKATLKRVGEMTRELSARGVTDAAFWVKGRPETITPAVLEAMREMGVLHVFIGLENASEERLAYLGRTHTPEHNVRCIELARSGGVLPSFNFMLFDPDCSLEDVGVTLEFAKRCIGLPWNVCRTEIYSGTGLLESLRSEGRLEGDYRSYGYVMRDARCELMFRILRVCLHERAFAFDSLLNRLISLSFARQVHERFFPGRATDAFCKRVNDLTHAVHTDTLDLLWKVHDFVNELDEGDTDSATPYALRLGLDAAKRDLPWNTEAMRLWEHANVRGHSLNERIETVEGPHFNRVMSFS